MKLINKTSLVCIILTFALLTPVVAASEPRIVNNDFGPFTQTNIELPNGNIVTKFVSEQTWNGGGWEGTIVQKGMMYTYAGSGTIFGVADGVFTGTIDGKSGTVKYTMWQVVPNGDWSQFKGKMRIIRGTGELKGIKGYGKLVFADPAYTEVYMRFE